MRQHRLGDPLFQRPAYASELLKIIIGMYVKLIDALIDQFKTGIRAVEVPGASFTAHALIPKLNLRMVSVFKSSDSDAAIGKYVVIRPLFLQDAKGFHGASFAHHVLRNDVSERR
ncbi:hypothetical protein SDC9_166081 [bioreactor metagenome]|uniref:Uncharacterized protein n=1 Tax=bioreactor metagenome TaxID=1076179 RepID=A0A645FW19_9ZZZZ